MFFASFCPCLGLCLTGPRQLVFDFLSQGTVVPLVMAVSIFISNSQFHYRDAFLVANLLFALVETFLVVVQICWSASFRPSFGNSVAGRIAVTWTTIP